jgi:hypothetical protein
MDEFRILSYLRFTYTTVQNPLTKITAVISNYPNQKLKRRVAAQLLHCLTDMSETKTKG